MNQKLQELVLTTFGDVKSISVRNRNGARNKDLRDGEAVAVRYDEL